MTPSFDKLSDAEFTAYANLVGQRYSTVRYNFAVSLNLRLYDAALALARYGDEAAMTFVVTHDIWLDVEHECMRRWGQGSAKFTKDIGNV